MEPFEIQLLQQLLTVRPKADGSFDIWEGSSFLGNLMPSIKDDMTNEWLSKDLIGYDYAQQIGELISEREM